MLKNNSFTKDEFIKLMSYPMEWMEWDMYPDELFIAQSDRYETGHEDGSEHDRNGAFHWWLKQDPTKEQLKKIIDLTYLDPEKLMGADVRRYVLRCESCDSEIRNIIGDDYIGN